ncbi:VID27 cytoplasmic protein-domain-containing protein [Spinellus fusiger]|nr:VID27 cytoplasmic protein-domain-containing protein [Spinellus fusiger]
MTKSFLLHCDTGNNGRTVDSATATENTIASLPLGHFSVYFRQGLRTVHEDIFRHAKIELQSTAIPFRYSITVSCLIIDDESSPSYADVQTFSVNEWQRLTMMYINQGNNISLTWIDSDTDEVFEYICDHSISGEEVDIFMLMSYGCMYEDKYNTPREEATEQDIQNFMPEPIVIQTSSRSLLRKNEDDDHCKPLKSAKFSVPSVVLPSLKIAKEKFIPLEGSTVPFASGNTLVNVRGNLSVFRADRNNYTLLESRAAASITSQESFEYWIVVSGKHLSIAQRIDPKTNPHFNKNERICYWNYFEGSNAYSMLLEVPEEEEYDEFSAWFVQSMYESSSQLFFSKLCKGDQYYVLGAYDDEAVDDYRNQILSEDTYSITEEEEEEEDYIDSNEDGLREFMQEASKNTLLAVSHNHHRSMIVRGNKIGIYQPSDLGKMRFSTLIPNIMHQESCIDTPSRILLHENEASLLLLTPSHPNQVLKMDLERGQIVETWNVDPENPIVNIASSYKYAQGTPEPTIMGITSSSVFKIDPRQPGSCKIKENEHKQHRINSNFSALTTTATGKVAVASKKGDIRLFDDLGKTARNILPLIGGPILHIDVTPQGRYVIATCATCLILVDVLHEQDEQERLGFEVAFDAQNKPMPLVLRLRPEHVVRMKQPISFTPARFDMSSGEEKILTSTGSFVVVWDMKAVLAGRLVAYNLQKFDSTIVEGLFETTASQDIVVAVSLLIIGWNVFLCFLLTTHHSPLTLLLVPRRCQEDVSEKTSPT